MNTQRWIMAALAGVALAGCGSSGHESASNGGGASPPVPTPAALDFTQFVTSQVGTPPTNNAPVATDNFANLNLNSTTAFVSVAFSGGDALPTGTYSAAAECATLGTKQCNPGLH